VIVNAALPGTPAALPVIMGRLAVWQLAVKAEQKHLRLFMRAAASAAWHTSSVNCSNACDRLQSTYICTKVKDWREGGSA
jgi:hypothetical protein